MSAMNFTSSNIRFTELPFERVEYELVEPRIIDPIVNGDQRHFRFQFPVILSKEVAKELSKRHASRDQKENNIRMETKANSKVLLRIGKVSSSGEIRDLFPADFRVHIDGKSAMRRQRQLRMDISDFLPLSNGDTTQSLSLSTVDIQWKQTEDAQFGISIVVVKRMKSQEMLRRYCVNRLYYTRGSQFIENCFTQSFATTMKVSLICPGARRRMVNPCRGPECTHIQCFEGLYFMEMCLVKETETLLCPLCCKQIDMRTLVHDDFTKRWLKETRPNSPNSLPHHEESIILNPDGYGMIPFERSNKRRRIEIVTLDGNDD